MTLYSYTLRFDDGAAPNPYWGVCTLAICKPAIRRAAKKGDWVVGLGSKGSPDGDISGKVVYAMRVTAVLTLAQYDKYCRESLPRKIPAWTNSKFRRKVGDCIYDYRHGTKPILRPSVHTKENRQTDLRGKNVLLSRHFYYFGDQPIPLPRRLLPIVQQTQGHKSRANDEFVDRFVAWIEGKSYRKNAILGEPQEKAKVLSLSAEKCRAICSKRHREDNEQDGICP
jgi:hypothetical protein